MSGPSAPAAEYHLVEQCRSARGDSVWVQWLGYPKSRNCWRSVGMHFPLLEGDGAAQGFGGSAVAAALAAQSSIKVAVRALPDAEVTGPVLQGRKPPRAAVGGDIPTHAKVARERPSSRAGGAAENGGNGGERDRRSKKSRRNYETKVHTIRVGADGVKTIRGVKTDRGTVVEQSSSAAAAPSTSAGEGSSAGGEASSSAAAAGDAAGSSSATGSSSAPPRPPSAASRADERAQLWAAHSQNLRAQEFRYPKGYMFRIEVTEVAGSQLSLHWTFPTSSPGDASAWIGLWDCSEFDWATGQARPRYTRFKSLTSTKQEGVAKISPKEFQGLPDGEYVFSIDTGTVPCGAADSSSYCVSQRVKVEGEQVVRLVGQAHGAPLPPSSFSVTGARPNLGASGKANPEKDDDDDDDDDSDSDDEEEVDFIFEVPLMEYEAGAEESSEVKKAYALVDKLSYLDWGLRTEDNVVGKRAASLASQTSYEWQGCIVHDGAVWGEAAHGKGNTGPKTASTSEGYGEATCATIEKVVRLLAKLTDYVPALDGWPGPWNLDSDATFLDIGSGYGKVVFHAKMYSGCRCAVGVECVEKRAEISTLALQGLYGELDREKLDDGLLGGVSFSAADACAMKEFDYSHVYIFDRVFSGVTLRALAKVLQRSPFYIMLSSRKPQVWWGVGLSKIQPVAKLRFKTTGRESMTIFVYVNSHYIPGLAGS